MPLAVTLAAGVAAAGTVAVCIAEPGAIGVTITIGGTGFICARAVTICRALIGARPAVTGADDRRRAAAAGSRVRDGHEHSARPIVTAIR